MKQKVASMNTTIWPNCGLTFNLHSVCTIYETISTVLVSDVKRPYQTMLAISTESVPVQLSGVTPPTTMSSLWGRTATKHRYRGVVMLLMNSQELVVVLYMWMAVVDLPTESSPPTASSRPCSEAHVEKVTGVSASWCHTLGPPANDKVFSRAPRDCGWQD